MYYVYNSMEQTKQNFSSISLEAVLKADKKNSGSPFTVVSKATQKDYTFKIKRNEYKGKFYTHVYVETGYLEFTYVGSYFNGKIYKNRTVSTTPTAKVMSWILTRVESKKFDVLDQNIEFLHLGSCVRCGRTLTDQNSIKFGLGSVCRSY